MQAHGELLKDYSVKDKRFLLLPPTFLVVNDVYKIICLHAAAYGAFLTGAPALTM